MAQSIKQVQWSDEADDGLALALPNPIIREIVADEVRCGRSRLWLCRDGERSAYAVTRIDLNPTQLVIVCFQGSGMKHFGPWFIERATKAGIPIRVHVTDPRVERLLRMQLQFKRRESILMREPD